VGYNGTTAYADKVAPMVKVWHARLMGHSSAPATHANGTSAHATAPAPGTPRTFRLTKPNLMHGRDVKAFQQLVNARLAAWGIATRIDEDGVYGIETRHAAHQVALGLGLEPPSTPTESRRPRAA
jgi:hypothetical protein